MYVLDATPLVVLATADRLAVLDDCDERPCTTERVYEEVVTTGIERGYADARRIESAVEDDRLSVRSAPECDVLHRLRSNDQLSEADATVLATAAALGETAVMDEQYGRAVANAEGIDVRGTAFLVLESLKRGVVDADEARETVDAMLDAGWYCSPDLYAKIRRKIDELEGD